MISRTRQLPGEPTRSDGRALATSSKATSAGSTRIIGDTWTSKEARPRFLTREDSSVAGLDERRDDAADVCQPVNTTPFLHHVFEGGHLKRRHVYTIYRGFYNVTGNNGWSYDDDCFRRASSAKAAAKGFTARYSGAGSGIWWVPAQVVVKYALQRSVPKSQWPELHRGSRARFPETVSR